MPLSQEDLEKLIRRPACESTYKNEVDESVEYQAVRSTSDYFTPKKYKFIEIYDSKLIRLRANNIETFRGNLIKCEFEKCEFTGLQLPNAQVKDVVFTNCRMNLANFRQVKFERCLFVECDLNETDFAASTFTKTGFVECSLEKTEFSNCQNKQLFFDNCSLSSIRGISGLKNATVSQQNLIEIAPLVIADYGINVTE